jgi:hypothetical protein
MEKILNFMNTGVPRVNQVFITVKGVVTIAARSPEMLQVV